MSHHQPHRRTIELPDRMRDADKFDVENTDHSIDAFYALHCTRIGWIYSLFEAIDLGFFILIYTQFWGEIILLMFSTVAALCFVMNIYGHYLVVRRVERVAQMVQIRGDDGLAQRDLPPLRRFALLTHSWTIARWVVVVYVTCLLTTISTSVAFIVYLAIGTALAAHHLTLVFVFIAWHTIVVLVLLILVGNFYNQAVVDSFRHVLNTRRLVQQYCRARCALAVNALLLELAHGFLNDSERERLAMLQRIEPSTQEINKTDFSNPRSETSKRKKKSSHAQQKTQQQRVESQKEK
jgi:hypothetical protein